MEIDRERPILENDDGSFSTERTITVEVDGKHYVIPTIVGGKEVPQEAAILLWRGGINRAVGEFATADEANAYAVQRSQEIGKVRAGDRQ